MGDLEHALAVSSSEPDVVAAWTGFVYDLRRFRESAGRRLAEVREAAPELAVAHAAAAAFGPQVGVDGEEAREAVAAAVEGRADNDWERSWVAASRQHVEGGQWAGLDAWRVHHDDHPGDLLCLDVLMPLLATSADAALIAEMARRARQSLAVVGEDAPLMGHLGVEVADIGDLEEAERLGTRALELEPELVVAGHPVAHVHFERGQHLDGAAWLGEWLPTTTDGVAYRDHLLWHEALHHLAIGDREATLACYRRLGESGGSRLFDGASMLWRCQLHGLVDPGHDPAEPPMSEVVEPLLDEPIPAVAVGWHVALGLASLEDVESLRRLAVDARSSPAPGVAELLPDLFHGLADYLEGDHHTAATRLGQILEERPRLGGSLAQREVLEDTWIECLVRADRDEEALSRLKTRLDRRPSRLDEQWLARVDV